MTATVLDRALVAGDAGQVTGERQGRPDPEVPERAHRRTFTAQYKQEVLAAYEAAPDGEKGAIPRRGGPVCRRPPGTGGTGSARRHHGRHRSRTLSGFSRGHWPPLSGRRSWTCCTAAGSLTWPRPRYGPRCWTRAPTSARCPLSTGCC